MSRGGNESWDMPSQNDTYGTADAPGACICVESGAEHQQDAAIYQSLFESMVQGVLFQDAHGTITRANRAAQQILGQTLEQLRAETSLYWQAIRADGTAFPVQHYPAMIALQTGETVPNVLMGMFHPLEQEYCWINASAVPLTYPGDIQPGLVSTVFYHENRRETLRTLLTLVKDLAEEGMGSPLRHERELHEKERLLAALQATQNEIACLRKLRSNFIATISHEFRTALTGIQGFSEILREQALSADTIKEFATDIYSDAHRLVDMINDIVELERLAARQVPLKIEWLNINAIINTAVRQMRKSTPQQTIRLHLAHALPILQGDRDMLTQVVTNLLSNALKYSPAGSEITVSSQIERHLVHVAVRDQGIGIPAVELERIFERYSPVEYNNTSYSNTKRLSLPIAREIIQMHGGRIWAESTPGEGSTFHFTVRYTDRS